jgi:putative salt-induced outer membrane protein YdiY
MSSKYVFTLLLAGLLTSLVSAETIHLQNGDRIQGKVTAQDGGTVTLETPYAGVITIQRAAILSIDAPEAGAATPVALEAAVPPEGDPAAAVTEEAAVPTWRDRWTGSVEAGATYRSGNTDSLDARTTAQFIREMKRNKLTLKLGAQYGEVEDSLNARGYKGEAKWQVYPRERFFVYTLGSGERDDARKLDYRFVAGTGVGYDFVKRERSTLSGEIGGEYSWERWDPFTPAERDQEKETRRAAATGQLTTLLGGLGAGTTPLDLAALQSLRAITRTLRDPFADAQPRSEAYPSIRIGAHYEQKLGKASTLTDDLALLPNLEDFSEFRMTNEVALITPLSKRLALKVSLQTQYDSLAEQTGGEPWDNTLVTGLRFEF